MERDITTEVKKHYRKAALTGSCCSGASCSDPITSDLYNSAERELIPEAALTASLGCGNPAALAQLRQGETVLDLGSGGGVDVLLSARRVGPTGKVYGIDFTDEMLELANRNLARTEFENVEFLKGRIEDIPLPDNTVDTIISNCVLNLAVDKDRVLREAFRVLKPGGRLAISDIVLRRKLPDQIRSNPEFWVGCVAGALEMNDYIAKLREAGFVAPSIEFTRILSTADARVLLEPFGDEALALAAEMDGAIASGFVRAVKSGEER